MFPSLYLNTMVNWYCMDNIDSSSSGADPKFLQMPEKVERKFTQSLAPGETVQFQLRAHEIRSLGGQTMAEIGHPWFVITNQRLLLVAPGLTRFQVRTFKFDQINSIDFQQGLVEDLITIRGIGVNEIWAFWKNLREVTQKGYQLLQSRSQRQPSGQGQATPADPLTELKMRLVRGEITIEEFNKLKDVL